MSKRLEQLAPEAVAARRAVDVHRGLADARVARSRAVLAEPRPANRLAIPRVGDQEGTVARLGDRALDLLRGPEPGLEGGLALLDALVVDTRDRGGVSRSCRSDLHFHSGLSVP